MKLLSVGDIKLLMCVCNFLETIVICNFVETQLLHLITLLYGDIYDKAPLAADMTISSVDFTEITDSPVAVVRTLHLLWIAGTEEF